MVRVCAGAELPHGDKGKFYLLRTFGNSAHEIWDVTDPAKPVLVTSHWSRQGHAQELVGVRHAASPTSSRARPGWRTRRMTQIYDL